MSAVAETSIDVKMFASYIIGRKRELEAKGSYPSCIALPADIESPLVQLMLQGKLKGFATLELVGRKNHKRPALFLAGIRILFTDKAQIDRPMLVACGKDYGTETCEFPLEKTNAKV